MYGTAYLKSAKDMLPLQAAFEAAPHDVKIIVKIARFFARRGMLPGAITYMRQALGIEPENSTFHRELGKYYNQIGRNDDALYHIRRAVESTIRIRSHLFGPKRWNRFWKRSAIVKPLLKHYTSLSSAPSTQISRSSSVVMATST
jgi:tetratricopeptide (TPR) repeat protein